MNRDSWNLIKNSKRFNVNIYRRGLVALIVSLGISCVLAAFLFRAYLFQPERDYYATNGAMPPIQLTVLFTPNMSGQALLQPDPPTEPENKVIPQ